MELCLPKSKDEIVEEIHNNLPDKQKEDAFRGRIKDLVDWISENVECKYIKSPYVIAIRLIRKYGPKITLTEEQKDDEEEEKIDIEIPETEIENQMSFLDFPYILPGKA